MKVGVLGAGVVGVTSAWYLAQAGHEVVVIDRQPGPGLETSFANAGEISPGYASPWAAPGIPMKALKWLFMEHAPLILRPKLDMAMLQWLAAMLRNCTAHRYEINKRRMVAVAQFSRDCLAELRAATGITYDERTQGTLQLFRNQKQFDDIEKDTEVLRRYGVPYEVLDAAQCIAAEPGLGQSDVPIAGGLRLPNDETGDCFKFTQALARLCAERGVMFRYGREIRGISVNGDTVASVITDRGFVQADAYLVALGSYSPQLLKRYGITIPVYPVKGYSITADIIEEDRAPVSTIMDETYKIAITRLGDRIRVGGMAEISGFNCDLPERRRATLVHSLETLFPGAANIQQTLFWSGLRPMTPDSTPIIGPTRYRNLHLNTGHGTLGWTMACGSARLVAEMMSGSQPSVPTGDLAISRYNSKADQKEK